MAKKQKFNSLIFDETEGFMPINITDPQGLKWWYQDRVYYLYTRIGEVLKPYTPGQTITISPDNLYRRCFWQSAKRCLTPQRSMLDKIKVGLMVIIILACLFFLFIIVS